MTDTDISLVDIASQQAEIMDDIRPDIEHILRTGAFMGGSPVVEFERAFAAFMDVRFCVGAANGTDALEMALRGAGVRQGDEVVIPANTFIATAEAAVRAGSTVVLCDVDDDTLLIDPEGVGAVVTERTRAIIPVHLYGQAAPVEQLQILNVPDGCVIVEDAAQSQGARRHGRATGSLGDVAATSFYPGKNLGAAGDAGAVLTNNEEIARAARLLGNHGSETKYLHETFGFNSRLDALQAVVLSAKLRRLERWNSHRKRMASRYDLLLRDLAEVRRPVVMSGNDPVWHLYVVRVPERDKVLAMLREAGVGAAIHYPTPLHLTPAFAHLGYHRGDFPVAETASEGLLSLPIHAHLTADQQDRVVEQLSIALERVVGAS